MEYVENVQIHIQVNSNTVIRV